jgi:hypothetical protein
MEDKIYIISKIDINFRNDLFSEVSFEKIPYSIWKKFSMIKDKKFHLETEYDDVQLKLNQGWIIETNLTKKVKYAIHILWEFLPHHGRIRQCVEEYEDKNGTLTLI